MSRRGGTEVLCLLLDRQEVHAGAYFTRKGDQWHRQLAWQSSEGPLPDWIVRISRGCSTIAVLDPMPFIQDLPRGDNSGQSLEERLGLNGRLLYADVEGTETRFAVRQDTVDAAFSTTDGLGIYCDYMVPAALAFRTGTRDNTSESGHLVFGLSGATFVQPTSGKLTTRRIPYEADTDAEAFVADLSAALHSLGADGPMQLHGLRHRDLDRALSESFDKIYDDRPANAVDAATQLMREAVINWQARRLPSFTDAGRLRRNCFLSLRRPLTTCAAFALALSGAAFAMHLQKLHELRLLVAENRAPLAAATADYDATAELREELESLQNVWQRSVEERVQERRRLALIQTLQKVPQRPELTFDSVEIDCRTGKLSIAGRFKGDAGDTLDGLVKRLNADGVELARDVELGTVDANGQNAFSMQFQEASE